MNRFEYIKNYYSKKGLKIFPLYKNSKKPMIDAWQKDCSSDLPQLLYWLENGDDCNFGLPANENDLFIIDVDMHEIDGVANFKRLCTDLGIEEPKTLKQTTPSGGVHYIFKSDDELKKVMNSANCFKGYEGIDIRTRGYIAVAPSCINGVDYVFDTTYDVNVMEDKLREFILNNNNEITINKKISGYVKPEEVEKGGRDIELFGYITQLYHNTKLGEEEIRLLAHQFNRTICKPPLSDSDVEYKVKRMFKKERAQFILLHINKEEVK